MRVQLSYTVDEEDVLVETGKIINLSAEDLQHAIDMFNGVVNELKTPSDEESGEVNVGKVLKMIEDLRHGLVNVDTRLAEATQIVLSYDEYTRGKRNTSTVEEESNETGVADASDV